MQHNNNRTVTSIRTFNTSPEKMLDAWTDPAKLAKWWGPKGFTNTFHEFDPTPGGKWLLTMHGPNGANYHNESIFLELGLHRVVLTHINPPVFKLTATFEAIGNDTRLIFEQEFDTVETFEKVKHICIPANEENFDRLEAVLNNASNT